MKIDLDDLERKASAAVSANPRWYTETRLDELNIRPVLAAHIAANSPPVTLALVARIRELEVQARRTIDATGLTVEAELEALGKLLEKGAVLP